MNETSSPRRVGPKDVKVGMSVSGLATGPFFPVVDVREERGGRRHFTVQREDGSTFTWSLSCNAKGWAE